MKLEKYTVTLGELIENNVEIFDFYYPFYSEEYRKTFEKHFINHFYFSEIGQETVSRFKQRLKNKFNLIMPYWNKIFLADELEQRILDNYDVTETYESNISDINNSLNENDVNSNNTNNNKILSSEQPVTRVDFENIDYFDNISKDIGSNESTTKATSKNKNEGNRIEKWKRNIQGNYGVQTDAKAIIEYWGSLRKIELEIFEECSCLFMEVY